MTRLGRVLALVSICSAVSLQNPAKLASSAPCATPYRLNDTDFGVTVRVTAYPLGVTAASPEACCAVCTAVGSECVAWLWMGSSLLCYPVASFDGFRPHASYVLGLRSPPPPPPAPQPPPPEWLPPINAGDMLYSPAGDSALPSNHMPSIGNGRVATLLMADAIYAAGVFNGQGLEYGSHRARIPATHAVSAPGLPGPAALNVREATYYRRSTIVGGGTACTAASTVSCVNTVGGGNVTVEQRWYAHRALPSLLVMEVQVIADASAPPSGVEPYAMLLLANNAGLPSADFNFTSAPQPEGTPFTVTIGWTQGTECPPGACGAVVTSLFGAAVLSTAMPATSVVPVPVADAHATLAFFTVIRTSVETFPADDSLLVAAAAADYAAAAALAAAGTLHATHVAEWASTVWTSGFSIDRKDVALAVNTSLYSIVSSLRNDVFESTSPGGGSTDSYNGHSLCVLGGESPQSPTTHTPHP